MKLFKRKNIKLHYIVVFAKISVKNSIQSKNCHIDKLFLSSNLCIEKPWLDWNSTEYSDLFEAQVLFGIVIWGVPSSGNMLQKLVLQKHECRYIFDNFDSHVKCRQASNTLAIAIVMSLKSAKVMCVSTSCTVTLFALSLNLMLLCWRSGAH